MVAMTRDASGEAGVLVAGPLTGVLIVKGYVRSLSLLGVLLTAAASIFCFFRPDYVALLVFLPLAGVGQGLCMPVNSVLLNRYFERHLSRASGASLAGSTLASFLFPPAVTLLLESYGLQLENGAGAAVAAASPEEQECLNAAVKMSKVSPVAMDASAADLAFLAYQQSEERYEPPEEDVVIYEMQRRNQSPVYQPTVLTLPRNNFVFSSRAMRPRMAFFGKPFYYLLAAHWLCSSYVNFCLLVTLVDLALGEGVGPRPASFLLSAYSVGDLVGRLFSGWVSDRRILSRAGVMALSCLVLAVVLVTLPYLTGFGALLAASVAAGWCVGSCAVLFSVMMVSVAGLDNLPVAVGCTTLIISIATIARPGLIVLFRDVQGSYSGLYVAHAVVYGALFVAYMAHSLHKRSIQCRSLRDGC
ncbi:hypothetical protein HPB48_006557 [Haemaphysalis longicornis]|uniref:Monocarboxylate transporter n=1 Tax=Haemaphysalis longicornis TaxID=44386 RepID=A0A9J6GPB3_HAELO|nr:hypothetical protein HPB48_006557 [Haemaphysalis longicornis]